MATKAPKNITQGLPIVWETTIKPRSIISTARLIIRGPAALSLESSLVNGCYAFQALAADTANLVPGLYFYAIRETSGVDSSDIERGQFRVLVNLENVEPGFDGLSENQKALNAINATLAARTAGQMPVRYRINNRELYNETITELMKLQRHYQRLVNQEMNVANGENVWNRKLRISMK